MAQHLKSFVHVRILFLKMCLVLLVSDKNQNGYNNVSQSLI